MENIKFREATIEDLETLYEFEQGIVTAERPFDSTLKAGHINYYDLGAYVLADDVYVLVTVNGDEVLASGYTKIVDGDDYRTFTNYAYLGFYENLKNETTLNCWN